MRKILCTGDYGAGWVSWHQGPKEQKLFMLEYQPFIQLLEKGERIGEDAIEQFELDWAYARFCEDDLPYMGGVDTLRVVEVPDGCLVRITEYDGLESVQRMNEGADTWL